MGCVKFAVLILSYFTGRVIGECTLDRNEHNKYPFVLKLTVHGTFLCHGSLLTPRHVLSAHAPVSNYLDPEYFPQTSFIGQVLGPGGALKCEASRTPDRGNKLAGGKWDRNMVLWEIGENNQFNVTPNKPYLMSKLDDMEYSVMRKNFEDTIDEECCHLPLFADGNAQLETRCVAFIKNIANYWNDAFCRNSMASCLQEWEIRRFFAYDHFEPSVDAIWLQGAVVVCNRNPLGILSSIITDARGNKITVFEPIMFLASMLQDLARNEWPAAPVKHQLPFSTASSRSTASVKNKERQPENAEEPVISASTFQVSSTTYVFMIFLTTQAPRE